jgi:hypothetical protein
MRDATHLKAADEGVVNLVAKELGAMVVYASPSPHVLVATVASTVLQNACSHSPHDHAENEPSYSEHGVVDSNLLGSLVTTAAISNKNSDTDEKRDTGDSEDDYLRPRVCVVGPRRESVHGRQSSGGVEDRKRRGDHGHDDKTAAEADTTECELGHADAGLDFLCGC